MKINNYVYKKKAILTIGSNDTKILNSLQLSNKENTEMDYKSLLNTKSNGNMDGDKIMDCLLPLGNYDVFISHSHKDVETARRLAKYIENNINLKCFIDSNAWGNVDELQKFWDEKDGNNYNSILNHSTNTRMMLATSLLNMINKCKSFVYLCTDNSADILNKYEIQTESPWLFFELTVEGLFENKCLKHGLYESIDYSVDLTDICKICSLKELVSFIED